MTFTLWRSNYPKKAVKVDGDDAEAKKHKVFSNYSETQPWHRQGEHREFKRRGDFRQLSNLQTRNYFF